MSSKSSRPTCSAGIDVANGSSELRIDRMKLNIILKFILVVGIPLIMVYLFVGYMQYRSDDRTVKERVLARPKVSVELTANSIDERLILIGTATRSLAGYAAIDPKSTRRLQAELLRDLINTDMLIASAVIAWGDPRKGGLEGISMTRGDGGLQSDLLSDEMARRLIGDYESLKKNSGGWMALCDRPMDLLMTRHCCNRSSSMERRSWASSLVDVLWRSSRTRRSDPP